MTIKKRTWAFLGVMLLLCGVSGCASPQWQLKINELLAKGSLDSHQDWIELYNPTDGEVSLAGLQLKDGSATWDFPAESVIPAKGYLKIVCDDSGRGERTNFKLSSEGETLTLQTKQGVIIDQVTFPKQEDDISWGRSSDGSDDWRAFPKPTPGASNQ